MLCAPPAIPPALRRILGPRRLVARRGAARHSAGGPEGARGRRIGGQPCPPAVGLPAGRDPVEQRAGAHEKRRLEALEARDPDPTPPARSDPAGARTPYTRYLCLCLGDLRAPGTSGDHAHARQSAYPPESSAMWEAKSRSGAPVRLAEPRAPAGTARGWTGSLRRSRSCARPPQSSRIVSANRSCRRAGPGRASWSYVCLRGRTEGEAVWMTRGSR
jgi:hypothetical protein